MTRADPWGNVPRLPGLPGITVVEGDAFMIADPIGDVRPGTGDGLFHRDTRFLNGFRLEVDVPHGRLWLSPAPPDGIERLALRGLAIGGSRVDVRWSGGLLDVEGLPADLTVITERAPLGAPARSS